jgi:5'-deoxynucleotidase YfbR-like HD superfamily hydrolase
MLAFAVVLSLAAVGASDRYIVNESVDLTETAVQAHFSKLPQFAPIFHSSGPLLAPAAGGSGGTAANAHDHSAAASGTAAYDYGTVYNVVRLHFDIYNIAVSNFFGTDGTLRFSYQKAELGRQPNAAELGAFRAALSGTVGVTRPSTSLVQLWMPIMEDGKTIGVAAILRDITEEVREVQRIQLLLLGIIVLGTTALFFALRQVFLRSTGVIARQNDELGQLLARVERTYDESLQALTSALDYRDNETQGHSFRVTSYALLLGKTMGLGEEELNRLARGALLHDVGKIGVPDAILLKPGKLDDREWETMRRHVQLGYEMLKHIEFLQPSLDVVLYHHERWDGKGYPHAIGGEQIPLFARIFALCDTYDAMTSDRPYRKGLGYEAARAEIERCRGTQFSPDVVDAFLSIDRERWTTLQLAGYEVGEPLRHVFEHTAAASAADERS